MVRVAVDNKYQDAIFLAESLRESFEVEIRPIYPGGDVNQEMDNETIFLMLVTVFSLPKFAYLAKRKKIHALIFGEELERSIQTVSGGMAFSFDLEKFKGQYSLLTYKLRELLGVSAIEQTVQ